jgi:hypothetical protein
MSDLSYFIFGGDGVSLLNLFIGAFLGLLVALIFNFDANVIPL